MIDVRFEIVDDVMNDLNRFLQDRIMDCEVNALSIMEVYCDC